MKKAVLIVALTAGAVSGWAQERSGFTFTSPLLVSGGLEDQMLVGNSTVTDSTAVISTPTMSLLKAAPRTDLSLTYTPEFQLFSHHSELNTWNHAAGVHLGYKMSPRASLSIDDSFLQTQDPTRALGETIFLLPRGRFRDNVFGVTVGYNWTQRLTVSFGYDNTISDLRIHQDPTPVIAKQMANVGTAALSRIFGEHHHLSATYSLLTLRNLNGNSGALVTQPGTSKLTHSAGLGYRYAKEHGLAVDLSGGIMRAGIQSYNVAAGIEKRWRSLLLGIGYSRQISLFRGIISSVTTGGVSPDLIDTRLASGVLQNSVLQAVTFKYRQKLGNRVGLDLRGLAGRNNSISAGRNINSLTGRLRLYFRVTARVSALVGAESYDQNFNELLLRSLERRRYYTGFLVSLSHHAPPIQINGGDQPAATDIATTWPAEWGKE